MTLISKTLRTGLLTFSLMTLLAACGPASDRPADNSKANPNSGEALVEEAPSTTLTQEDLKLLGDADASETNSHHSPDQSAVSAAGLKTGYQKILGNIGDLSTQFEGLGECSSSQMVMFENKLLIDCPGVVGSAVSIFNIGTFTYELKVELEVKGSLGHALIKHTYNSSMMGLSSTRTIKDEITAGAVKFVIDGSSQITRAEGSALSISGTFNVTKNSGVVEVITVSSAGLQSGSCGLNSGTVTYTTASGLSHTVTFAACPVVEAPPIFLPPPPPVLPMFPPVLPVIPDPTIL